MLSRWPIRKKLYLQLALLAVIVVALSSAALIGFYSFRGLVKGVAGRANELPVASDLNRQVSDLRVTLGETRWLAEFNHAGVENTSLDGRILHDQFTMQLNSIRQTLDRYREFLDEHDINRMRIGDYRGEEETVRGIDETLEQLAQVDRAPQWMLDDNQMARADASVSRLQALSAALPSFLHERMKNFAIDMRAQQRTLIFFGYGSGVLAAVMLIVSGWLFYIWIFRPLGVLVAGSRRVAGGDFDHRIELPNDDEMAELARAMNQMTERFQAICADLDRQVRERTRQVVRSEQLASVGFLAAGVAHEINNPLASIAMCAESLERQHAAGTLGDADPSESVRTYLQMIQQEAFRCKEITEKLLDFSRLGESRRTNTDLRELVQAVIDMVAHLGKYNDKKVVLRPSKSVIAPVNPQELKQVLLNLIVNGLDSLDPGGAVTVELGIREGMAEIMVVDDGCGMTKEVLEHLFEPFYTRRRSGQGTGLGLSIAFRIVADHGGQMKAESEGPGCGSRLRVTLPLAGANKETEHRHQAA
ncbi:MAG: HAMP domain-containing histidine kinase [Planctomycetia bacterium]|nr:HAMP domain-containing histidine kinase [Planctomycetia bacterium]